jgi:hypothetical protein
MPARDACAPFARQAVGGVRVDSRGRTAVATADGLGTFKVNYGSGSAFAAKQVVLSNFVAVPEPSTWALLITGLGVAAYTRLRRLF